MPLKLFSSHLSRLTTAGLSLGAFLLLGSSGVMASTTSAGRPLNRFDLQQTFNNRLTSFPLQITQSGSTAPDVIIDTDPSGSNSGSPSSTPTAADPRFTCQVVNGQYTVVYHPQSQPDRYYPWAVPRQMGGGWSPERRCEAISQRLEAYRADGLSELLTGVENGYDTVCVTTQAEPRCRIVFTVPPGQDPLLTRDLVFENLARADSGLQTQGVNTFTNRGGGLLGDLDRLFNGGARNDNQTPAPSINLRPFLDPADGGTGTKLRANEPASPSQPSSPQDRNFRLNPDLFR